MSPDPPSSETSPARRAHEPGVPQDRAGASASPWAGSTGASSHSAHPRRAAQAERRFGASIGYTVLGAIIPGAGLIRARHYWWGAVMIGGAILAVAGGVGAYVYTRNWLIAQAVTPATLTAVWIAILAGAALWVVSLIVTHLSLRPRPPKAWQRIVGALVVALLAFAIAAPALLVARRAYDQAAFVRDVFSGSASSTATGRTNPLDGFRDPWADKPRLNVLILGGDSGKGRADDLGARTDTVIVASINTRTGDSVLYQLPRQTARMPFPAGSPLADVFPNGFTDGSPGNSDFFLNSMYDHAPKIAGADVLRRPVDNLGAEILKISVGEALGLDIDYYTMINMDGFVQFVDALGGVTVNVNKPVPMGGRKEPEKGIDIPPDRWLAPGPDQHLNGMDALWYARGRYGVDDYERGIRQRCVISAVVKQANPTTIITNYEAITKAGREIIQTDVPSSQLPPLVSLAMKAREQQMRSVAFVHGSDGFSTVAPDWETVRARVRNTLNPAATAPGQSSATPTRTSTASGATPSNPSVADVGDACAYHPEP